VHTLIMNSKLVAGDIAAAARELGRASAGVAVN
jgi:hypothetical protein